MDSEHVWNARACAAPAWDTADGKALYFAGACDKLVLSKGCGTWGRSDIFGKAGGRTMQRFTRWKAFAQRRGVKPAIAAAFWLLLWTFLDARLPGVLFAGPLRTAKSLLTLLGTETCWRSLAGTLGQIAAGFLLAFSAGLALGALCYRMQWLRTLLLPVVQGMKSVPVACFVIVALIWTPSSRIAVLLSAFVVFPITYQSVLSGLSAVDRGLLEMAQVFRMPFLRRLRFLYIPQVAPFVLSSCRVSVGMCWKAGIAGEIIGLPRFSVGEQLYLAKLYLNTGDLFAWTLLIVAVSICMERLVLWAVDRARVWLEDAYGCHF